MNNPIAKAVEHALLRAREQVQAALKELEAASWDLDVAAPYPTGTMSRPIYKQVQAKRDFFSRITMMKPGYYRIRRNEPYYVEVSNDRLNGYYEQIEQAANAAFDAYVAKLNARVGETTAAELDDNAPLWNGSVLTVVLPDGSIQRWKTQMILNVSCLGKLFNQWPTRRVS